MFLPRPLPADVLFDQLTIHVDRKDIAKPFGQSEDTKDLHDCSKRCAGSACFGCHDGAAAESRPLGDDVLRQIPTQSCVTKPARKQLERLIFEGR
jgi:hypothetical protein